MTELADTLVRDHRLSFGAAHGVARRVVEERAKNPSTLLSGVVAAATGELLGSPIHYTEETLQHMLSARHFVEVRATHGGPAPGETARALDESRAVLEADRAWLRQTREHLSAASERLKERSAQL
jgi:argininosuccinate lyase